MQMTGIIGERETRITQSLYTMGMLRSAYWLSWITWEAAYSFLITWVTIGFGAMVQLDFFLQNSVGNTFFTIFLFQLAMLGFAFTLSALIRKTSTAIVIGFAIFILGWIFQVVTVFGVSNHDPLKNRVWLLRDCPSGHTSQPDSPPKIAIKELK